MFNEPLNKNDKKGQGLPEITTLNALKDIKFTEKILHKILDNYNFMIPYKRYAKYNFIIRVYKPNYSYFNYNVCRKSEI